MPSLLKQFAAAAQVPLTMSSREIALVVGATHDSVLKTVRQLVERGVVFGNETPYTHPQNQQTYPEYLLDYRNTMVVVSGYSAEVRARIIDRWQDLEAQQVPQIPQTMAQALRLAADQAEQIEKQAAQLALAAPMVEFVKHYVQADSGSMGLRQVCKVLKAKQPDFTAFLLARGLMYRTTPHGPLTPRAEHVHAGRFEAKTGTAEHGESSHAYVHYKFTAKGLEWIARLWGQHQAAQQTVED
ncbi:phage antirepressor KilAC domain-containing protein [Comamonas testosteroni]|uniref:phage antirepressor KilAC domain-containing protein n=1 Tax=Comamonas testosteroni TaxID=285 RepID=UPI00068CB404|nr:phage antirepressor KilAC domain-containing protein [Comamonas testosteroni]